MRHTAGLLRLALGIAVLCGGWVALAQVISKEKAKSKQPAAKAAKDKKADDAAPVKSKADLKDVAGDEPATEAISPEVKEIQAGAAKFVETYNAHDAQALSKLFAQKAEFTDESGELIQGREAIEADFTKMFEEFPDSKIAIEVDSIRVLTPHIALEEGVVVGQPLPDGEENLSRYVAIHVKVEGEWLIGSVSDAELAVEPTPHDHLQELAWMVGDWLDESPDAVIKSSCDWDASGNYLLHEFYVQAAGGISASGSMRIGWDPLTRQFKSWTFDADGGYAEGLWSRFDDEWVVKVHGVKEAGEATSGVGVFRYIDEDTMTWRSYDRTVGGMPAPSVPENVIKRHPPAPEG